jgi:hypothetical protein
MNAIDLEKRLPGVISDTAEYRYSNDIRGPAADDLPGPSRNLPAPITNDSSVRHTTFSVNIICQGPGIGKQCPRVTK